MSVDEWGVQDLEMAVARLDFPVALIDLQDLTIRAVSKATLRRLDRPVTSVLGHSILELLGPSDHANAKAAFAALSDGAIDFYSAHRRVGASTSRSGLTATWVRGVELDGRRMAFVEATDSSVPIASPLATHLGSEPPTLAIGTINRQWKISSISAEAVTVLGLTPTAAVGRTLISPHVQDVIRRAFDSGESVAGEELTALSLHTHFRDSTGRHRLLCVVLTALAGLEECLFVAMPDPHPLQLGGDSARVAQLEFHLRRIAAEIAASAVLVDLGSDLARGALPQMSELTARQWEVLARLTRGERVPSIAKALFVSQSTVRNHLTAIFERFGVHSQPELLEVIRATAQVS